MKLTERPASDETINALKAIFEKHKKERICVVGTMCCGKTALIKQLTGYNCIDMDDKFWCQASEEEIEFYGKRPFTKEMCDSLRNLVYERIAVEPGFPLWGIYIIDCEVVILLDISESLLEEHCKKRGDTDFIDALNLKKWIEDDVNNHELRNDKTIYSLAINE